MHQKNTCSFMVRNASVSSHINRFSDLLPRATFLEQMVKNQSSVYLFTFLLLPPAFHMKLLSNEACPQDTPQPDITER